MRRIKADYWHFIIEFFNWFLNSLMCSCQAPSFDTGCGSVNSFLPCDYSTLAGYLLIMKVSYPYIVILVECLANHFLRSYLCDPKPAGVSTQCLHGMHSISPWSSSHRVLYLSSFCTGTLSSTSMRLFIFAALLGEYDCSPLGHGGLVRFRSYT